MPDLRGLTVRIGQAYARRAWAFVEWYTRSWYRLQGDASHFRPIERRWTSPPRWAVTIGGLIAAFAVGVFFVIRRYGGSNVWPSMVADAVASFLGVFLALYVERKLEARREAELQEQARGQR